MFGCVKTLLLFYQTNFRVNVNAEFLADRSPHGIRKSNNIRSRGTTRVHQYQRLPAVHRSRPQRLPFPATPVYHPGSRYLYPAGIHIIVGHYDFLAYFNMEEVIPHTAYKTISGLILDELDHIPQTGEKLHWNRFTLEIVDMDGARIDKILVTPDTIPADENS